VKGYKKRPAGLDWMSTRAEPESIPENAIARLGTLAPLTREGVSLLQDAARSPRRIAARHLIVEEGQPVAQRLIILSGWACRVRILNDGRRQILGFMLPGDLLGNCRQKMPVAVTTVMALTNMVVCAAPCQNAQGDETGLEEAFAISSALEEHYLFRSITRLGRLSALERLADWILEIHERLARCDGVVHSKLRVPLTQEVIADALGLTPVHVNRTLQALRRDEMLQMRGGLITLINEAKLASLIEYRAPIVTAAKAGPDGGNIADF
jgi:CRP-like cAMP-binding protein